MELNLEQIKDILDAFEERNMQKLELRKGDFEITLERSTSQIVPTATYLPQAAPQLPLNLPSGIPPQGALIENQPSPEEANAKYITSPMVGTFYASPSPKEPPFLKVGDFVKEGQVVCIIEAMKVMNEVKATESGVVKEMLLEDGHPVEFGSKIVKLG